MKKLWISLIVVLCLVIPAVASAEITTKYDDFTGKAEFTSTDLFQYPNMISFYVMDKTPKEVYFILCVDGLKVLDTKLDFRIDGQFYSLPLSQQRMASKSTACSFIPTPELLEKFKTARDVAVRYYDGGSQVMVFTPQMVADVQEMIVRFEL